MMTTQYHLRTLLILAAFLSCSSYKQLTKAEPIVFPHDPNFLALDVTERSENGAVTSYTLKDSTAIQTIYSIITDKQDDWKNATRYIKVPAKTTLHFKGKQTTFTLWILGDELCYNENENIPRDCLKCSDRVQKIRSILEKSINDDKERI